MQNNGNEDSFKWNETILQTVHIIRKVLKDEFENFPISCCFEASLVTENVLRKLGYNIQTYGDNYKNCEHYWNVIDGKLFDVTADQYNEQWGFKESTEGYKGEKYSLKSAIDEYINDNELAEEEIEEDDYLQELIEVDRKVKKISKKILRMI